MMCGQNKIKARLGRPTAGFTLTEMLVTLFILTLTSTLLATGIPVAIDTYHKVVNSSNAQLALSTTIGVLRSELGTASDVRYYTPSGGTPEVFYKTDEGYWVSISNPSSGETHRGLMKQFYSGDLEDTDVKITSIDSLTPLTDGRYALIPDASIPAPLQLRWSEIEVSDKKDKVAIKDLRVYNEDENKDGNADRALAIVVEKSSGGTAPFDILTRFAN